MSAQLHTANRMNSDLPMEFKAPLSQHPYQKFVKRVFAETLKYSHNSIYANPVYPVKLSRRIARERDKFTVFGIRSIPEFNYCVQVVQGLHKYRTYLFEAPDIQAVTPVDWPKVWLDLKVRFGGITHCVQNQVVILLNGNLLGGTQEFEDYIKTRYNYYLCLNYYNLAVESFIRFVRSSGKPHAYMHITIDGEVIGTFIFRLYSDVVPSTCDNFLRLCHSTRGGYGGTPVHRIVKDNWIQCGGYGLKSNPYLDCENFKVPFDRRGVLGMANDGRNCDCSTQFFVLLQPSPWMSTKYVAFGQLIDGEQTLAKIEKVPTFYESPLSEVVIAKAGILNLESSGIVVSPGTNEYIESHIEDLVTLGAAALGWVLEKVDKEIELIEIAKLKALGEGQEESEGSATAIVRNTERFMKKKGDMVNEITAAEVVHDDTNHENEDFDVEEYEYVLEEEFTYKTLPSSSLDELPPQPYYLPLTDVTYPDEKDSTYDLKKFLKGDYCLESDLQPSTAKHEKGIRFMSGVHHDEEGSEETLEEPSDVSDMSVRTLGSEDEEEIRKYLRVHSDHVSFAGGAITGISKGVKKYLSIYDVASTTKERKAKREKKVSIDASVTEFPREKIKRRQTGYTVLPPSDMENMSAEEIVKLTFGMRESCDTQGRHVRIVDSVNRRSESSMESLVELKKRLMSGPGNVSSEQRLAVMRRLYEKTARSEDEFAPPTLKDYRPPIVRPREKATLLTHSQTLFHHDESVKSKMHHASFTKDQASMEQMLTLQHGKKFARKISSDYVTTIDQFERPVAISLRTLEYAKQRPAMSVAEYQMRNDLYEENLRKAAEEAAARAAMKESDTSLKIETKMEPPEMFSATSQTSYQEEEASVYDDIFNIEDFEKQYSIITRHTLESSQATIGEEPKILQSFMEPPQSLSEKSDTSTNLNDAMQTPNQEAEDSVIA